MLCAHFGVRAPGTNLEFSFRIFQQPTAIGRFALIRVCHVNQVIWCDRSLFKQSISQLGNSVCYIEIIKIRYVTKTHYTIWIKFGLYGALRLSVAKINNVFSLLFCCKFLSRHNQARGSAVMMSNVQDDMKFHGVRLHWKQPHEDKALALLLSAVLIVSCSSQPYQDGLSQHTTHTRD